MAELINPLSKPPSFSLRISSPKHRHLSNFSPLPLISKSFLSLNPKPNSLSKLPGTHDRGFVANSTPHYEYQTHRNLREVHSVEEFDAALLQAKDNLVLVEYIASRRRQTPPVIVELSRRQNDGVCFILVTADESEKTRELCRRENVEKLPQFSFHKNKEKLHVKPGLKAEEFVRYAQYYGNSHRSVIQLRSKEHVAKLMEDQRAGVGDQKLIVVNVGMRNCEPCVKIYPTVVRLSEQMDDGVVFARLVGDDNGSCMEFVRSVGVVRVPTFLFIRGGEICSRYEGSVEPILVRKVYQFYSES